MQIQPFHHHITIHPSGINDFSTAAKSKTQHFSSLFQLYKSLTENKKIYTNKLENDDIKHLPEIEMDDNFFPF